MAKSLKICAVIPAYNEAQTIGEIIQQTKRYVSKIYVVNNCCTDDTERVAKECGVEVLKCSQKGYGISQYTGQLQAINDGFDYIVQLDADGQHNPHDIKNLIIKLIEDDYDIVLGSRFLGKNALTGIRKLGIGFFSRAINLIFGGGLTDVTSGFKIYKVEALKKLHKHSNINPAVGQMAEMAKKKMKIGEIPIESTKRLYGNSHLSLGKFIIYPLRGIFQIVKVWMYY